ncbi:MAG TPA: LPS assembly protein LptD [Micavibrio sp.]|nr:LPS assembly protein LptD [Micavibrio sp.]
MSLFAEKSTLNKYGLSLLAATFLSGAFCLTAGTSFAAAVDGQAAAPEGDVFGIPSENDERTDQPVDLEADQLIHDENRQIVTATGNVELVQAGRILKADAISYNLRTDQVRATGNVVLSERDGTTYFADDAELTKDMKEGFVQALNILLADGSRFSAEEGTRKGTILVLQQATYTPCEPCKENPQKPPLWQIRAKEVEHDEADKKITYRNAWFEFAGVPVAYTPYFSHPDGSERQKSGFLTPWAGYDSELGGSYQQEYYYAIAPDKDATIGTVVYTGVNPVLTGEYRQRFENAEIEFSGSGTYSDRTDTSGGRSFLVEDEARGHLFADGLWNMDDKWRSGFRAHVASDDQYLRQYDIDSDDVLENELYAERFSGRDYAVGRMMAFQDVRTSYRQVEQPAVLPEVITSFYGDPNGTLGGRWNARMSALGLYRDGSDQDMARTSAELGWQRKFITGFGLVNTFDALMRGDAYNVQDRDPASPYADGDSTLARGFAMANLETSYPLVKRFERAQMIVSPLVSFTAGTNVDYDGEIPNEDSQDFTLDPTNLFEPNRFPGYDRIEDRTHMTYGVRTGLYGDNGYRGEVFFGQSRRFEDSDNPFNEGSGLSDQDSDYVGQISASLGHYLNADYRFQLENTNMSSQRHELDVYGEWDRLQAGVRYFYANALRGTDLNLSREQIRPSARFRFYGDWYALGGFLYDFAEENRGLRQAYYGIDYLGQCITFGLTAQRSLTSDSSGDSGTEIMLRIGFKNLGEFETSGISLGSSSSDDNDDDEEDVDDIREDFEVEN